MQRFFLKVCLGLLLTLPGVVAAQESGLVIVGINADAQSLDPVLTNDATTIRIIRNIYDPLFFRDRNNVLQPELVESYEWDKGLVWTIKLREGVEFHNGEPFNAEAVKFTLDYILDEENNALTITLIDRIAQVDVVDDYTVQITTTEPFPTLLENLAEVFMAPPKLVEERGMEYLTNNPVGTGAFMFESWRRGERLILAKNPNYFKGEPQIDRVEFRVLPDVNSRVAALLAGEVDIIPDVPPQMVDVVDNSGIATVKKVEGRRIVFVALDTINEGPLQDVRVRQAINYAVDVPELIETILEGNGTQLRGPLLSINNHFDPTLDPYPYDPERALQLLEEAGYSEGELKLTLHTPDGRYLKDREFAEGIAAQLARIGVEIQVNTHEWGTYLDLITGQKAGDMHVLGRSDRELDGGIMYAWFKTGATYVTFSDPEIDSLLDQSVGVVDPEVREETFNQLQQRIHDAAPWIFLWGQHDLYGVSNRVDWEPRSDEQIYLFEASLQ